MHHCMNVKIKIQYCCTMVAWECKGSCLAAVACKLGYLKKDIGDAVILSATVATDCHALKLPAFVVSDF